MMLDDEPAIVIPVGPEERHRRYLAECIASAFAAKPSRIIVVADGAPVELPVRSKGTVRVEHYVTPWPTGVPNAFNAGVALANGWALMLGSDDMIEPDVFPRWRDEANRHRTDPYLTYWALPLRYMDTGEEQSLPCNAAIVHTRLWRLTGGFPPETASGACDAALLSIMLGNYPRAGMIREIPGPPLYHYRRHQETDTASRGPWQGVILATRDILTRTWEPRT